MHTGGFSNKGLQRIQNVMGGYVERGEIPGVVTLGSRRGKVHVEALGRKRIDDDSVQRDTIFRISPMTKPIIAAATMILDEECKLRLRI
jgi:CubicO group peptidase (beta-lactamase class C family)